MLNDPYGTHVPVLQAMGKLLNPRRVLEFGTGFYSTLTFLNRDYYAGLKVLHAVESDPNWVKHIRQFSDDKRLRYVEHPATLVDYDMVFVDNGQTEDERVVVLRALMAGDVTCPVIIHDSERQAYRNAVQFERVWEWTAVHPQTMVCWNGDHGDLRERMDEMMAREKR